MQFWSKCFQLEIIRNPLIWFGIDFRWLSDQRADQLVLLILVLALTVKFALFDDHTDGEEQTKDLVIESKKQFVRPLPVFKMDTRFLGKSSY